jgi:hypothetical protein
MGHMIPIRPHRLFNLVKTRSYEARMVQIVLPDQRAPILLDTAILLALAKLVQPRTYFEFGTYLGVQLINVAANLPQESRLYTLDLDEESATAQVDEKQRPLTVQYLNAKRQKKLAFLGSSFEERIIPLRGDSNTYDFTPFRGQMDMLFVDGGHELPTLRSDTENAFKMLSPARIGCIAWHDYGNKNYPGLRDYIDELSESRDMFFVEESWMVFFIHKDDSLVAALKSNSSDDLENW